MTSGSVDSEVATSRSEIDQSSLSARAFEPLTRSLFSEAGLQAGMRVLDAFSGVGDVAFLAREIVGSNGHVTGFDPSAGTVAYANERAAFRGMNNVEFIEAEADNLPASLRFDAIVGRAVLIYRRDPVQDLRALAQHLRAGGLVVFQEFDLLASKTVPRAPLIEQVREWILETFASAGLELEMGPKLYETFKAAGLSAPQMRIDGFTGGAESVCPALVANVARLLLPQITSLGVARMDEVQIDTLEDRMRADLYRTGGVMSVPPLIGAWGKLAD